MAPLGGFLLALAGLASLAAGDPCTKPAQRFAWHKLSNETKLEYINAELCLMKKPARLGLPGARTRFDELQAIHQLQSWATHFVGAFLPFHRLMMFAHETALRTECGYTGYQPYWQEQLDAGRFSKSVVFDPVYGFGGNGRRSDGCITDGPFANYTNALGPGYMVTDHCIDRGINDYFSLGSSQGYVDYCLRQTTWERAWQCIEAQPHTGGHGGVGRQMQNPISSPGDPLFYLHHTWLDKLYWDWQKQDRANRTSTISGSNIGPEIANGFNLRPPGMKPPTGADGDPGKETTLGHVLNMYGNSPNKTIADVLDIQGNYLCYEYVEP
ncbi:hypothetical protein MAPG_08799 [Magnaporthiopsis poae ATCC 64411]|uniref:Tyrosinase copper-binding domain-containing protein n=1 Tax=Magnaporthiopsis poae (strain ATCC 64411 / 73-15) TaxID=644358 RepID=A0A0C4E8A2_MAGP6|nr:hypothetical protein MAPG_08799 [Magnaporthiopsis poae ATCC 64411]